MDPQALYNDIKESLDDSELSEKVANLFEWLQRGGFPPIWSQQALEIKQKRNRQLTHLMNLCAKTEVQWVQALEHGCFNGEATKLKQQADDIRVIHAALLSNEDMTRYQDRLNEFLGMDTKI